MKGQLKSTTTKKMLLTLSYSAVKKYAEQIEFGGHFVMNSKAEIAQAYKSYN
jgi:redox-sensitive bicupin YhaK (pirin superfamily)